MLHLTSELSPKQFTFTVVAWSGTMFGVIALLNYVVNPYAQYSTSFVPPAVQTSRDTKVALLHKLGACPDGIILGSSRVLKLEPDYLSDRLGGTFFNAGVNFGKPEDFLALQRYCRKIYGQSPKTVFIGLDVHGFSNVAPVDARLLSNRHLASLIGDSIPWGDRFQRWKELLSWQQTMQSIKSLKRWRRPAVDGPPTESFQTDGMMVYHQREGELAAGTYDFPSALEYTKREYRQLSAGFTELSPRRCESLTTLIADLRSHGSKVYVFLTPLHPELNAYLADTSYSERRAELLAFLARESAELSFEFCDLSNIEQFEGDPTLFVDGVHPLESNTRKMVDRMIRHSQTNRRVVANAL